MGGGALAARAHEERMAKMPEAVAETERDNQHKLERLKKAVHRHKPISKQGLQERLFTLAFSGLVYPQIWEDPVVDLEALQLKDGDHLVGIASGGCNILSYLTAAPVKITAIDLNPAHIALNKLKVAAVQHLPDYRAFHRFFAEAHRLFPLEPVPARAARHLHRRRPSARARPWLQSPQDSHRQEQGRAARDLRGGARAAVRKEAHPLAVRTAVGAVRARHSAVSVRGLEGQRAAHVDRAAQAARTARLRLRSRR